MFIICPDLLTDENISFAELDRVSGHVLRVEKQLEQNGNKNSIFYQKKKNDGNFFAKELLDSINHLLGRKSSKTVFFSLKIFRWTSLWRTWLTRCKSSGRRRLLSRAVGWAKIFYKKKIANICIIKHIVKNIKNISNISSGLKWNKILIVGWGKMYHHA